MIVYNTGPLLQKLDSERTRAGNMPLHCSEPVLEDILLDICFEIDEILVYYQGNRPMPQDVYNNAVELLTEISFYR